MFYNLIMFEDLMRRFFKADVKTHVLAVDLATSFISAALAVRPQRTPAAGFPSSFSVIKTFSYPLNLVALGIGGASRPLPQIFKDAFLKVFRDARNTTRHLDAVLVGLADPFFLEVPLSKQISRKDPKSKITLGEINDILKELENDAKHQHNSLLPIGREILGVKINGYDVNSAEGYVGKTLEITAVFTLATSSLRDFFNEAKEKFFPGKPIYYFSDVAILRRVVSLASPSLGGPAASSGVIFNIDGEVTSVFYLNAGALNHVGMAPFGFSTIARRLASSFKISAEDAASLLRRYLSGALEESQAKKVGYLLEAAEENWWGWLQNDLKTLRLRALPKFILTSREQNLEPLMPFFMKNLEKFYGADVGGEVINQNDLAKNTGNNRFLAGLIAFSSW